MVKEIVYIFQQPISFPSPAHVVLILNISKTSSSVISVTIFPDIHRSFFFTNQRFEIFSSATVTVRHIFYSFCSLFNGGTISNKTTEK